MSNVLDSTRLRFAGVASSAAEDLGQRLEQLNAIGASLSAERDINRLLEALAQVVRPGGRGAADEAQALRGVDQPHLT